MARINVRKIRKQKPKKAKAKKPKPSAINRAIVKSGKESARRAANRSGVLTRRIRLRVKAATGQGRAVKKPKQELQDKLRKKGISILKKVNARFAAFVNARYGAKAIAKYQDYAGRLRRSIRLRKQVVKIDDFTYVIRQYTIKTNADGKPYRCTCPDFSQVGLDGADWLGSKAGPFNPCKHMMAVRDRDKVTKWKCLNGVCVKDPTGTYLSKAECDTASRTVPFSGGQCPVQYFVNISWRTFRRSDNVEDFSNSKAFSCVFELEPVYGPIEDIYITTNVAEFLDERDVIYIKCGTFDGYRKRYFVGSTTPTFYIANLVVDLYRCDGLADDCGDPKKICGIQEPEVFGCMNPSATNYDPSATLDDGSCTFPISGCTNPSAINYNPSATVDDGSCILPVPGCTNPSASNYDPSANTDDGSCIIDGCTDPEAYNYNPDANNDDGSCNY